MKIAIHHRKGSFSDRWVNYCEQKDIDYKIVNAFDSDIIEQLKGYDAFMWHHHHGQFKDVIVARNILFALEYAGIKVFPNFKTSWYFDDKVAQKYLLESIDAPLIPSYVFYDKKEALDWAEQTSYPKVFKLKGGAGSSNVKLVENESQAKILIKQAFGKGFSEFQRFEKIKEGFERYKRNGLNIKGFIMNTALLLNPSFFSQVQTNEKGYVYFQEFIPHNNSDTRVIVINHKAFAIKRLVRENDFRASGSGEVNYNHLEINLDCIKIAFEVNDSIRAQSIAYDFVFDKNDNPLIVEISYGFSVKSYDQCSGYWDRNLKWHKGSFNPQEWMISDLIKLVKSNLKANH